MTRLPTIWAVVCTDVDGKRYVFEMATVRREMVVGAQIWRNREQRKRRYSVVRYEAAPPKPRARTAANALKNFDKTFGSMPELLEKKRRRK